MNKNISYVFGSLGILTFLGVAYYSTLETADEKQTTYENEPTEENEITDENEPTDETTNETTNETTDENKPTDETTDEKKQIESRWGHYWKDTYNELNKKDK